MHSNDSLMHDIFLKASSFAVAGASRDRTKYGNLILRQLLKAGRLVFPINPNAIEIESLIAYPNLTELPEVPEAVSIVTPPEVTGRIVSEAIEIGVKHLWIQPGAENPAASKLARAAGINVIDDGSCILVALALMDRQGEND